MYHKIIVSAVFIVMAVLSPLAGQDIKNVIAYPVPFNPVNGSVKMMTIGPRPGATLTYNKITCEVFDINGDRVLSKTIAGTTVRWNGRNGRGKLVKPGLYIIKVVVEDTAAGEYGKKMIRVLIQY